MMDLSISFWDSVLIFFYIFFIIGFSLLRKRSASSQDYFLAGRSISWYMVGASLFAASISISTLIGQSGDVYNTGVAVFNYNLISVIVLVFFAWFVLPFYIQSKIFTVPEYFLKRFDRRSKYYFSFISILVAVFLDAASTLYAGSLLIQLIVPEVKLSIIIICLAIAAASYTIPGGLSSVISLELFQGAILYIGSAILTYYAVQNVGDWSVLQARFADSEMLKLIRPLDDASVPWLGLIVGIPVLGFYFWCTNQTLVQRVLSAKSVHHGRMGVLLAGFLTLGTFYIIIYPAMLAHIQFPGLPKPDMVYGKMVLQWMPTGLLGIIIAALLTVMISTIGATLNSAATLLTMDFYLPFKGNADNKTLVRTGRLASVGMLVLACAWAPQIGKFQSLVKYYQEVLSYIAPPIVAALLLGLFSKRVNGNGAFWGLILSFILAIIVLLYRNDLFPDVHFLLIVPVMFGFSVVTILAISYVTSPPLASKLIGYTYSKEFLVVDFKAARKEVWYKSFLFWSAVLLLLSLAMLVVL